jgi:hypothetical protein
VQYDWDGKSKQQLIDQAGSQLELGMTEQVVYVRGTGQPVALAEKIADALQDLRDNLKATESSTHRR